MIVRLKIDKVSKGHLRPAPSDPVPTGGPSDARAWLLGTETFGLGSRRGVVGVLGSLSAKRKRTKNFFR